MDPRHRDGLLALAALAGVFALGAGGSMTRPVAAAVGVFGALAIEVLFYRFDALLALWEREWVRLGGLAVVLAGGYVLALVAGPWTLAALAWGLITYLGLLVVSLGRRPEPRGE
ncbi:hypothetical protein [Natronomonas sp. EA1]|uniref:hypothetical protein n=1 Tax=Natronomonas sp. EA1 TaxID=3421655 RepID=UPI003EBB4282